MATATTALHIQGRAPEQVEAALEAIFAREERPRALRLQGTYSAVLARALDETLDANYRYLLLNQRDGSPWTTLLELGNRTEGLDRALSAELGGAAVVALFAYGNAVSGYRVVRGGAEVDRYVSDPEYLASIETHEGDDETPNAQGEPPASLSPADVDAVRGRPERFADLLPSGTSPQDVVRVVLAPGWWEEHEGSAGAAGTTGSEDGEDEELVDEDDRMRCIGLALELWKPDEYPFAGELEEIPNKEVGPAVALAFA